MDTDMVARMDVRKDERGFAKAMLAGLIMILIAVLFFAAVISEIQLGVWDATDLLNTSSPGAAALLGILVLLTVVAVIAPIVAFAIGAFD